MSNNAVARASLHRSYQETRPVNQICLKEHISPPITSIVVTTISPTPPRQHTLHLLTARAGCRKSNSWQTQRRVSLQVDTTASPTTCQYQPRQISFQAPLKDSRSRRSECAHRWPRSQRSPCTQRQRPLFPRRPPKITLNRSTLILKRGKAMHSCMVTRPKATARTHP